MNEKESIAVSHLTVNYDQHPVIWDIEFAIPRGEIVAIVGPNGAGKSTLIKSMLGLVPAVSGKVRFFGESLEESVGKIAYVGQRANLDWDFPITVFEVVMMGLYGKLGLFKRPGKKERKQVEEVLDKIGMREFSNRQISELSGGQQQRLFIARALIQEAEVLFLDEPFAGIDMATEKLIVELLKELALAGKTIFIVHHDLSSVPQYFTWTIMLNLRTIAVGPVSEVFHLENIGKTFGQKATLLEEALRYIKEGTR